MFQTYVYQKWKDNKTGKNRITSAYKIDKDREDGKKSVDLNKEFLKKSNFSYKNCLFLLKPIKF